MIRPTYFQCYILYLSPQTCDCELQLPNTDGAGVSYEETPKQSHSVEWSTEDSARSIDFKIMVLKLYSLEDGPPSLSCRQTFAALGVPFELVDVSFINGEHMTEEFAKMNPQKEIPVLDDDGFFLSESVAIVQYVCDKYKPGNSLYPTDAKARAIINHRLLFNWTTYYAHISAYTIAPMFFAYERTPEGLRRVHMALQVFETYLERLGTSYAAGDNLTIADFPLVNTTMTLEAVNVDFSKYTKINKWYNDFKKNHPDLWKISADGMKTLKYFEANPPDLSHLNHPLHPARKQKA